MAMFAHAVTQGEKLPSHCILERIQQVQGCPEGVCIQLVEFMEFCWFLIGEKF